MENNNKDTMPLSKIDEYVSPTSILGQIVNDKELLLVNANEDSDNSNNNNDNNGIGNDETNMDGTWDDENSETVP